MIAPSKGQKLYSCTPAISVILPVFNAQSFVKLAVESVLSQTHRDFELLILDDGSTDNSLHLLRQLEAQDTRVKVFTRENRGLVDTLNELITKAKAPYIARMDADDICVETRLEKQISFLDANPDHVAVGASTMQINHLGLPISIIRPPFAHGEIDSTHLRGHAAIAHPAAMIRKSAIRDIGGYRKEYLHAEDLDLWLRLGEIGKLANLEAPLLLYRIHDQSISQRHGLLQQCSAKQACEAAWARRGVVGHFEPSELWRAESSMSSRHRFAIRYGWTAWANGYRPTWRHYVTAALRMRPFHPSSWKLLIFGLRNPATRITNNLSTDDN